MRHMNFDRADVHPCVCRDRDWDLSGEEHCYLIVGEVSVESVHLNIFQFTFHGTIGGHHFMYGRL